MSEFDIFNSDKVDQIVTNTLNDCDDGELYVEDNLSENFNFDDNSYFYFIDFNYFVYCFYGKSFKENFDKLS